MRIRISKYPISYPLTNNSLILLGFIRLLFHKTTGFKSENGPKTPQYHINGRGEPACSPEPIIRYNQEWISNTEITKGIVYLSFLFFLHTSQKITKFVLVLTNGKVAFKHFI